MQFETLDFEQGRLDRTPTVLAGLQVVQHPAGQGTATPTCCGWTLRLLRGEAAHGVGRRGVGGEK
jgi:hypothetical protein